MKHKWWIFLLVLFLAVVLLSLLINRQSQRAASELDLEIQISRVSREPLNSTYAPPAVSGKAKSLPAIRRGITITAPAAAQVKNINSSVPRAADRSANKITGVNLPVSDYSATQPLDPGITKSGKVPSPKEAQEMNSAGIVMY